MTDMLDSDGHLVSCYDEDQVLFERGQMRHDANNSKGENKLSRQKSKEKDKNRITLRKGR